MGAKVWAGRVEALAKLLNIAAPEDEKLRRLTSQTQVLRVKGDLQPDGKILLGGA